LKIFSARRTYSFLRLLVDELVKIEFFMLSEKRSVISELAVFWATGEKGGRRGSDR
jgi:hypothetical protein